MSLIARENTRNHAEPVVPGVYAAICYGVIDLGIHENRIWGGDQHKILLLWELPDCRIEFEKDGEKKNVPRTVSHRYTLSLSERANLRRDLENWRGRKFTQEELQGFDLKNVLGAACQLQVVQEESHEGRMYAKITSIMALPRESGHIQGCEHALLFFSFDDIETIADVPKLNVLPDWIQKIVMESKEWRELTANSRSISKVGRTHVTGPDDYTPF